MHEDLQERKLRVRFVSHALTAKQKEQRLNHTYDLIETIKSNLKFLDYIITGDVSYYFVYDPETKGQSSKWCGPNTPSSKKFQFQILRVKTMLILFFNSKGIIHDEYVPEGQTETATFYVQVLGCLCKRIAHVRPKMWRDRKFFLLHNNVCPHTAAIVQQFLTKKGVAQLSHSPYSPDLSPPSTISLFQK